MNGLMTKCEVKMAVHQPSSFLHNFVDRDKVKVHKNRKSNQVNNQPSNLNKFGQ